MFLFFVSRSRVNIKFQKYSESTTKWNISLDVGNKPRVAILKDIVRSKLLSISEAERSASDEPYLRNYRLVGGHFKK